jgi:hypothetical protein
MNTDSETKTEDVTATGAPAAPEPANTAHAAVYQPSSEPLAPGEKPTTDHYTLQSDAVGSAPTRKTLPDGTPGEPIGQVSRSARRPIPRAGTRRPKPSGSTRADDAGWGTP